MIQNAHIVSISGGMSSFFAARRVRHWYGEENLYLIFADTMMEDEDLYRFLRECLEYLGGHYIDLCQHMTPWDVFKKARMLGNSMRDPCSRMLKRQPIRKYIEENFDPETCTLYLGFGVDEFDRFYRSQKHWLPFRTEAPMTREPYILKEKQIEILHKMGIRPPKLYGLGFVHNNCGGFCVKAGQKQFKLLYETMPERFDYHMRKEQEFREWIGKDVSILRRQRDGVKELYPLTQLKAEILAESDETEENDWGGCRNCFSPENDEDF